MENVDNDSGCSSQEGDDLCGRHSPSSYASQTSRHEVESNLIVTREMHEVANNDLDDLTGTLTRSLHISKEEDAPLFLCDMGYGLPREERPRKERLNAIAKQLVNFLQWQDSSQNAPKVFVKVVACPDPDALLSRLLEIWPHDALPDRVSVSERSLDTFVNNQAVYLSPDAPRALDPLKPPPRVMIVGMLIDRRVQPNRSRLRAEKMELSLARWPTLDGWDPQEPFNVDCIMEGMQQWHWNRNDGIGGFLKPLNKRFDIIANDIHNVFNTYGPIVF